MERHQKKTNISSSELCHIDRRQDRGLNGGIKKEIQRGGTSEARFGLKQISRPRYPHIEGRFVIRATAPKHITTRNKKITSPCHRIIRSKAAPLAVLPRNQVVQTQGTGLIGVRVLYTTFQNYDSDRGIAVFALLHMFTHQALYIKDIYPLSIEHYLLPYSEGSVYRKFPSRG